MANFVWTQYFCNGNPWNKVSERRMYDGRLDEPLDVTIGEVARQELKAKDTAEASVNGRSLRQRGGKEGGIEYHRGHNCVHTQTCLDVRGVADVSG